MGRLTLISYTYQRCIGVSWLNKGKRQKSHCAPIRVRYWETRCTSLAAVIGKGAGAEYARTILVSPVARVMAVNM